MKRYSILLACILPLAGQTQEYLNFSLDNGAQIGYQIWNGVESKPGEKSVAQAEAHGNVIRRTLLNQDGSPWLGFEMHVDKASATDFLVWFAPTAGFPFFAQGPMPRHVHDGDRVMLDVLEQPGTGKKVFDMFQLFLTGTHHTLIPLPMDSIPSMIPAGTALRLSHARLTLRGVRVPSAQVDAVASGSPVSLDIPRVGRFSFSSSHQPGYLLEAVASDDRIEVAGDDRYTIVTDSAVVDKPGSWFLWVRFESTSRSDPPETAKAEGPAPLTVSATPAGTGPNGSPSGLRLAVKNVSGKNVLAYAIQLRFSNPNSGRSMGSHGHSAFHYGNGTPTYLAPGQEDVDRRPISLPHGADGVMAKYAISVDLVIFEDGTQWGPASSSTSQQLLNTVEASGLLK